MVEQVKCDSYSDDKYSSDPQIQDEMKNSEPQHSYEESPRVEESAKNEEDYE